MKKYADAAKQILFGVLVDRLARFMVDQYVMPHIERLPTKKRKPFGFN